MKRWLPLSPVARRRFRSRPHALGCLGLACLWLGTSCITDARRGLRDQEEPPVVEYHSPYPDNFAGFDYWVGTREMNASGWGNLDAPIATGFLYRSYLDWEPLELEVGASFAYERQGGGTAPLNRLRYYEFDLGLGWSPSFGQEYPVAEPYVGGGVTLLIGRSDIEQGGGIDTFDDADLGGYVHGGMRVFLWERQYLFVDWRWTFDTELDLGIGPRDTTYSMISFGLGASF